MRFDRREAPFESPIAGPRAALGGGLSTGEFPSPDSRAAPSLPSALELRTDHGRATLRAGRAGAAVDPPRAVSPKLPTWTPSPIGHPHEPLRGSSHPGSIARVLLLV